MDLDPSAVRRLMRGVHVRQSGLRRLLDRLVASGLLRANSPDSGAHWGVYALTLSDPMVDAARFSPLSRRLR